MDPRRRHRQGDHLRARWRDQKSRPIATETVAIVVKNKADEKTYELTAVNRTTGDMPTAHQFEIIDKELVGVLETIGGGIPRPLSNRRQRQKVRRQNHAGRAQHEPAARHPPRTNAPGRSSPGAFTELVGLATSARLLSWCALFFDRCIAAVAFLHGCVFVPVRHGVRLPSPARLPFDGCIAAFTFLHRRPLLIVHHGGRLHEELPCRLSAGQLPPAVRSLRREACE